METIELTQTQKKLKYVPKPFYSATFAGRRCPHKHYTADSALRCMIKHSRDVLKFNAEVRVYLLQQKQLSFEILKVDISNQSFF